MHVSRSLVVNGDGTGVYTLTIGFREPTNNDPNSVSPDIITTMEAFGSRVQQTGGTYRHYEDQGYLYWTYTRPFASLVQANADLQEDPRPYDQSHSPVLYHDSLHIAQENWLFTSRLHVTGEISLADLFGNADKWIDATETVSVTMPDGVIAARGGTRVSDTVTYRVAYNQTASIDVIGNSAVAGGTIPSVILLAGVIVLVTLAIIQIVLGIRLLRRSSKP
jgi:hypothetical protein